MSKKTKSFDSKIKIEKRFNLNNEKALFITLHGGSVSAIYSKKTAKKFSAWLRDAADWVEIYANDIGEKNEQLN